MKKLLGILLLTLLMPLSASAAKPRRQAAKPRTSTEARSQRQRTQKELTKTTRELTATERTLSEKLRRIASLEENIARSTSRASQLKLRIDSIEAEAVLVRDSIAKSEAELNRLRELYTRAVRSSRRNRREMNTLTFIFSAETFRQAWRRMRYLEQYGAWRKRKAAEINAMVTILNDRRAKLEELKRHTAALRTEALTEQRRLRNDRTKLEEVVGSLKGRTRELNSLLRRQQSTLRSLDDEIERLIRIEEEEQRRREEEERRRREEEERRAAAAAAAAAESRQTRTPAPTTTPAPAPTKTPTKDPEFKPSKPASTSVGGSFAAQKGNLPSPLSHTYVIALGFGRQQHRSVSNLEVNNPGIDLETALGATARAVFPGTVSAVFVQDGLGHVVLIRHGSYLTVYANIRTIKVKKGDKLKTGDVIGIVGPSDVNPTRALLHFEIRNERQKLDPRLWLRR